MTLFRALPSAGRRRPAWQANSGVCGSRSVTVIPLAAAFWIVMKPPRLRRAARHRGSPWPSPVVGPQQPGPVITTDPPGAGPLILLALALASRPPGRRPRMGGASWITGITGRRRRAGRRLRPEVHRLARRPGPGRDGSAGPRRPPRGRMCAFVAAAVAVTGRGFSSPPSPPARGSPRCAEADALVQNSVVFPLGPHPLQRPRPIEPCCPGTCSPRSGLRPGHGWASVGLPARVPGWASRYHWSPGPPRERACGRVAAGRRPDA